MVCSHAHCCGETIQGEKVGGCTAHAKYCGAGTGIFLKIRDCYIILLHKMYRGSIIPAPYLDQYGETDQRLKRGNPLYLEPSRYSELDRAWLRNDIPEKIARMFDPDVLLLVEWQQF
ncbi:E3 ubiquitin-protein ligase UBR1 [Eurytemora carolleeae]|uniref:E3 ubiquitin-protein ligase UBR1 n=1 Tax=Eurytemora carolleeae TaxID=1294199 RepID=UPI000C768DFA|nr:E3 ubiquitin-protein ligase UBR1 [Eurytemora carolleeae]|eukprot:XP_023348883.1 E3 ubiquitin-protein ligase UBR1-like [Eurytemora affinis]